MEHFPVTRMRRNRRDEWNRRLVAENTITVGDLILPPFVHDSNKKNTEIPSMPCVKRHSIESLVNQAA